MLLARDVEPHLKRLANQYPVIMITGPRQSGKTTLCKKVFPRKPYISMEKLENRRYAEADPNGFLKEYPEGAIIDEIQRVPDLLSYIQVFVDEQNKEGLFILTGSHQFELMDTINQSLAGRTALIRLLPFSYHERYHQNHPQDLNNLLFEGFYPRIYDKQLHPTEASAFYVNTYIERDLRQLINIKDLSRFETFLKLCAGRTGQILNVSNLANDSGINHNTAQHWLSILEASYLLFRLRPHIKNFNKRLIKAPKLYFWDTGLAAYLLDIETPQHLHQHPLKGALFETFIIADLLKQRHNAIRESNLYYWRDNVGNEVDAIIEVAGQQIPLEIKLGQTVSNDYFKGLSYYQKLNPKVQKAILIYGGEESYQRNNVHIFSYQSMGEQSTLGEWP